MPAEYLIRQMAYYKAGTRKDDARMGPISKTISDEDVRQAAEYFAALTPRVWVKVIESATPPKTYIATAGRHRQLHPNGGTEPIGRRILDDHLDLGVKALERFSRRVATQWRKPVAVHGVR